MWWKLNKFCIILCLVLVHSNVEGTPRIDPLVDTNLGLIRGLKASDGDYSMFLGIPYATVDPENPFGPSVPHTTFNEVFEAYDDSAICPQIEEFNNTIVGTLDCLHLNIYVPNSASSRNRLPVLVWIYGGGFTIGFSGRYLYGPKYLVRHDVIFVTLNYRLGPYGFMCLDIPEVPGNQGMKDQLLGLRWIKENIASFGGDPDQITAFGESAGSISIDHHLLSSQEKLFNKVIMQSGTSLVPRVIDGPDNTLPLEISERLGFVTDSVTRALSFLATADIKLVIAAANDIDHSYWLCIENEFDDVERFQIDHPLNLNVPKVRNTPVLIGYNEAELMTSYHEKNEKFWRELNIINDLLEQGFNYNNEEFLEMEKRIQHFYFGDEELSDKVREEVTTFDSDYTFCYPTHRSIKKFMDNGADKIFLYVFAYNGKRNFVKQRMNITSGGAAHADEIGYLFDISFIKEEPTAEDQLVIDRMTTMWTNFVKYSDPTPEITELLPVKWESVTEDSENYLTLDFELSLGRRHWKTRMTFWDLFYKLYEKNQKGYRSNDN